MTSIVQGDIKITTYYSTEWQEYQVRLWVKGELMATYYSPYIEDARDTAQLMLKEAQNDLGGH